MLKLTLALLFIVVGAHCSKLSEALLDELIEKFEERRDDHDWNFCHHTGLECTRCPACHDATQGAMCITGATKSKCLCNWGWTGANAVRVPDANLGKWSPNRIRADDCRTPCHYTHDYWNEACLGDGPKCDPDWCEKEHYGTCIDDKCVPDCDEEECKSKYGKCIKGKCIPDCDEDECKSKYGKCIKGKCIPDCDKDECKSKYGKCVKGKCVPKCHEKNCPQKYRKCEKGKCVCSKNKCEGHGGQCVDDVCKIRCCRNLINNVPPYSSGSFDRYCHNRCEFVPIAQGCPPPHITPPCNPMCKLSGGKCNKLTGRCQCCKDFTGPNPLYENNDMTATHCGVWCPHNHKDGSRNKLCDNPDWVIRAEKNQNKAGIISDYMPFYN